VTVRQETIGREHSGKTALKVSYYKGPLQGAQASGLELTAADPRVMSRWMLDALETYRDLTRHGLLSTLEPEVTEYHLFEADAPRVILQLREVVGQVLTHTTPDSPDADQARYRTYVENLSQADVLQVVMSCPAEGTTAEIERYEGDLQLHASFLREALRVRSSPRPCAVALVLTKLDARFANEQEARSVLTDDKLRAALARLVRIATGSEKVGMAGIFPVSAFGFGNAVPAPEAGPGSGPAQGYSPLSQGEPEWLLKPHASPAPFNLTGLVWWTLMAGLLLKPADGTEKELARLANLLADDLQDMEAWFVPLPCRGGVLPA
jgi:hypothetical protein